MWALCFATYAMFFGNANLKQNEKFYFCDLSDILQEWSKFYSITLTLNVFLPLLILAVTYTTVCLKLWSRQVPGEGSNQSAQAVKLARKVTIMMMVVVVLYALCWSPFYIFVMLQYFGYIKLNGRIFLFSLWLTVCYSAINPYVYLTFSQNFRNGFTKLFKECRRKLIKCCNVSILPFLTQSVELEQM